MTTEVTEEMEAAPKRKSLLGRLRRRRHSKKNAPPQEPQLDTRDQTPSPKRDADEHHNTPVTDAEEGDWVNGDAGGDSNPAESQKQSSSLKQVRFPAKDALKTKPIYTEKTLLQAPSAREAAFGGPPRYDWIDIVRTTLLERMLVGSGRLVYRHGGLGTPKSDEKNNTRLSVQTDPTDVRMSHDFYIEDFSRRMPTHFSENKN